MHEIKGYTTMGEDRIEIAHQRGHIIVSQGATNCDKRGKMKIQSKDEQIRYNESITDV